MDSDYFFTLVPIACSFWVFFDACHNRIGPYHDEQQKIHGRSPIWWGTLTLFLTIIFFPLYLIRRKTLLAVAQDNPVKSDKSLGILILSILSGLFIWYFHLSY
ncbi:hypothetical protein [Photorhabdus luminescens]|uniref:Uncharacterized protein n=1 Tax=Photorhabdus luminescens subsp. mexicana TaxID=2100167 RepID=A0A4R4IRB5_PHOLU|nr:hypothetical protein [Photorhabdus luminescens]TDB43267.1 hypothetical protein C5468_23850 [Photorhabdus luminescens subsp. mexicana]